MTATVANPSIPLTLPKTTAEVLAPPPEAITISINQQGEVAWNDQIITLDELSTGNIEGVKIIYLADFLLKEEY